MRPITKMGVALLLTFAAALLGRWATRAIPAAPATAPAKLPYTISAETTAITVPLRADGAVDYLAALNDKYGRGVTPDNNGFVLWLQIAGPNIVKAQIRNDMYKLAGVPKPDPAAKTWRTFSDYLKDEHHLTGDALDKASAALLDAQGAPWSAADRPDLAAFLKSQADLLTLLAQAADKPCWWIPALSGKGHSLIALILPSLGPLRDAAGALVARGMLKMQSGDFDGFLSDDLTAKKLARQLGSGPTLIERLVAVGIDKMATESIGRLAGAGLLSADQCKETAHALDALPLLPPMADAVDIMERWDKLQYLEVIAAWDTDSLAQLTFVDTNDPPSMINGPSDNPQERILALIDRNAIDWDAMLHRTNSLTDEMVEAMRLANYEAMWDQLHDINQRIEVTYMSPMNAKLDAVGVAAQTQDAAGADALLKAAMRPDANETRTAYTDRIGGLLIKMTQPSIEKAEALWRWNRLQDEMLRALLAADTFKTRTGQWPATLNALVPGDLKSIPQDILVRGNHPVSYFITPNGIRIYSVGQDNKDDQGLRDIPQGKKTIFQWA